MGSSPESPGQPAQPPTLGARLIMSGDDITRIIDRISHQILETTNGGADTVLVGIPTRGEPLAKRIGERMAVFTGLPIPLGSLDITLYRDDLRTQGVRPLESTKEPDGGIDGKSVILVDDVLFSGRTIRAALDALRDWGRPKSIALAVLVDRGHRELPIRADYVGKNIPTSRDEQIFVAIAAHDGVDGVVVASATADRQEALALISADGGRNA